MGNVELKVKTKAHRTGRGTHRTIVLKDVLYVPTSVCNILGRPILGEYNVISDSEGTILKDERTGGTAGLFDLVKSGSSGLSAIAKATPVSILMAFTGSSLCDLPRRGRGGFFMVMLPRLQMMSNRAASG